MKIIGFHWSWLVIFKSAFILIFSLHAFSQDISPITFQLDDLKPIEEAQKKNEEYYIDPLIIKENEEIKNLTTKKYSLEAIKSSGKFQGLINKGTLLWDYETGKVFRLPKHIYVKAYKSDNAEGKKLVLDKKGKIRYLVDGEKIFNIQNEITQMSEEPFYYQPFKKYERVNFYDKKAKWSIGGTLYTGLFYPTFTSDLAKENERFLGSAIKGEIHTLFAFNVPFEFGIVGQLESYNMDLSQGVEIASNTYSLGPMIKTGLIESFATPFYFVAQYRWSLNGRIVERRNEGVLTYNYSSNQLQLGVLSQETQYQNFTFQYGAHFQRQWIKARANEATLSTNPRNTFDDSIMISFNFSKDLPWVF
jgi:hypothetical protein